MTVRREKQNVSIYIIYLSLSTQTQKSVYLIFLISIMFLTKKVEGNDVAKTFLISLG